MNDLRIYVDFAAPPEALELLQNGTRGQQLLFPRTPASSILGAPVHDPQFATADIAFGQPDPQAVAEAADLKWIHVSSSGITRYDNPHFRSLVAERKIAVSNSASVYERGVRCPRLELHAGPSQKSPARPREPGCQRQ